MTPDVRREIGPAEKSRSKLSRVVELIILLHGGPARSADSLAAALGVSKRTLFRYLNILGDAAVPYYFDISQRGYRIRGDFFFTPPKLTAEEALALFEGYDRLSRSGGHPNGRTFAVAWSKLESQLPPAHRELIDGVKRGSGWAGNGDGRAAQGA